YFSYPLGLTTQEANVVRARVQMNQVQAQLKQIELQIATDVTNAAVTVQSSVERVQASQAAREFAQKSLEAEQSKFEVGMSTNYNVIQSQRDLATAQNNELQAVLNYRKALVELERLQQTTLQNLNITVVSATGAAGTATLQAVTTVQVGSQVSGNIQWLGADFNSIVKKGQVIARLDPSLFEAQLQQANANLNQSRANLTKAQSDLDRVRVQLTDAEQK